MKNSTNIKTFESKIKSTFIRYGRIPLVLLIGMLSGFILYEHFFKPLLLTRSTQKEILSELNQYEQSLDEYFSNIISLSNSKEIFAQPQNHQSTLYEQYYQFQRTSNLRAQIIMYDTSGKIVFITRPSLEGTAYSSTFNQLFMARFENNDGLSIGSTRAESMIEHANTLIMGKRVTDTNGASLDVIAYIEPTDVENILQHKRVDQLVITDRFGYVIATTSSNLIGRLNRFNETNESKVTIDNTVYRVQTYNADDGSLKIQSLTLNKTFLEDYGMLLFFMALTLYIMNQANKKVAQRVGSETSESIDALMNAVNKIKSGDLDTNLVLNSGDEFELLAKEFNDMSHQLKEQIHHNKTLVELRKNAQIKQLEAQFNPHFLYNSLETIRYLIPDDPDTATRLILNITKLLRYSIDNSVNEVTFGDDLKFVTLYLDINKIRLGDRFSYSIDVSPEAESLRIPRLLIQPLIENSIKHGYRSKNSLEVKIMGTSDEHNIYIQVIDNGSGMDSDVLDRIERMRKTQVRETNDYGIHSIFQRLNLIFGPYSDMHIESNSQGTTITLTIPKGDMYV